MNMNSHLDNLFFYLLITILIIIIIYNFLTWYNITLNQNDNYNETQSNLDSKYNELNKVLDDLQCKIRYAEEKGIREAFQDVEIQNDLSFIDKSDDYKIMLFYKTKCPYSQQFLPIWYKIVNNLPRNVIYEEVDADKDSRKVNQYGILEVPSVVLVVSGQKNVFIGARTYDNIKRFLNNYGVNLVERTFEKFDELENDVENDENRGMSLSKNCPAVTFDKVADIEGDDYRFQIFNSDGQYGYAEGGVKPGKLLTPFQAAYSTVDSYLSSLPDAKDPSKSSLANVEECANLYSNDIINFGLCDAKELDKIAKYDYNVKSNVRTLRVPGTNYKNNEKIVNAIKKVCGI